MIFQSLPEHAPKDAIIINDQNCEGRLSRHNDRPVRRVFRDSPPWELGANAKIVAGMILTQIA
jgi:hypothetical protein